MYSSEQSRINAVTSYFFLGPIFLLAKKDTPLADAYVRAHSLKATFIIGSMSIGLVLYFFLRQYIAFSFFGISFSSLLLALIVGASLLLLMKGAYRAYQGFEGNEVNVHHLGALHNLTKPSYGTHVETEEEKIRILASMIPFIGIWVAKKYEHPLMVRGRIIGSAFAFFYGISLFLSGEGGFLSFLIVIVAVTLFVIEAVYLMLYNQWISWGVLELIPSYKEVEAHVKASFETIASFISVAFGKEKKSDYQTYYLSLLGNKEENESPTVPYFMPTHLLGLPFWNLFGLPSLWTLKYQPYRGVVIEGCVITLIFSYFLFFRHDYTSPWLFFSLFPIAHILATGEGGSPVIGSITHIVTSLMRKKEKVIQEEKFTYETPGI